MWGYSSYITSKLSKVEEVSRMVCQLNLMQLSSFKTSFYYTSLLKMIVLYNQIRLFDSLSGLFLNDCLCTLYVQYCVTCCQTSKWKFIDITVETNTSRLIRSQTKPHTACDSFNGPDDIDLFIRKWMDIYNMFFFYCWINRVETVWPISICVGTESYL